MGLHGDNFLRHGWVLAFTSGTPPSKFGPPPSPPEGLSFAHHFWYPTERYPPCTHGGSRQEGHHSRIPVLDGDEVLFSTHPAMADASHSELIARFTSVTGVDTDRAKFYLESSAWQLDVCWFPAILLRNKGIARPIIILGDNGAV